MNNRRDDIPVSEKKIFDDEQIEYYCPSASGGDMTGLIPYAAQESEDIEAYNQLFPYLPEKYVISEENSNKTRE